MSYVEITVCSMAAKPDGTLGLQEGDEPISQYDVDVRLYHDGEIDVLEEFECATDAEAFEVAKQLMEKYPEAGFEALP